MTACMPTAADQWPDAPVLVAPGRARCACGAYVGVVDGRLTAHGFYDVTHQEGDYVPTCRRSDEVACLVAYRVHVASGGSRSVYVTGPGYLASHVVSRAQAEALIRGAVPIALARTLGGLVRMQPWILVYRPKRGFAALDPATRRDLQGAGNRASAKKRARGQQTNRENRR